MFYLKETDIYIPPKILFLGINPLNESILQLEYETGLQVNDSEVLNAITNCIQIEENAKLELEYYCLHLVDKHCYGGIYTELELFLSFLIEYGNELLNKIKCIGLYHNGVFPYSYESRRHNSLRFIRRDVLYQQLKNELKEDGY